jgi:hypothetical protein
VCDLNNNFVTYSVVSRLAQNQIKKDFGRCTDRASL